MRACCDDGCPAAVQPIARTVDHASIDHLAGPDEERRGKGEAERPCGLEIDDELELGRLLDGQLAGRRTFEDLVYVGGGLPTPSPLFVRDQCPLRAHSGRLRNYRFAGFYGGKLPFA